MKNYILQYKSPLIPEKEVGVKIIVLNKYKVNILDAHGHGTVLIQFEEKLLDVMQSELTNWWFTETGIMITHLAKSKIGSSEE